MDAMPKRIEMFAFPIQNAASAFSASFPLLIVREIVQHVRQEDQVHASSHACDEFGQRVRDTT